MSKETVRSSEKSFLGRSTKTPKASADARERSGAGSPPNVVFILTDDQNFDTIGCYGRREVHTPHHDRLAAEGVRFDRGYATTSLCTPSRYGCLTGQFPSRCPHPQFQNQHPPGSQTYVGFNTPLPPDLSSLPRLLQAAGYRTGMVGKWHLGEVGLEGAGYDRSFPKDTDPRDAELNRALARHQEKASELVRECGFDYASRIYWNNPGQYGVDALKTHNMEWVLEGALDFIDQNSTDPFFLLLSTTLHHVPHPQATLHDDPRITVGGYLDRAPEVMPPRTGLIDRVKKKGLSPATAYCTYLDDAVGALLGRLDDLGLADDTVVVFFSDHRTPDKATLYEGGVPTPAMIRWPRAIPAGQVCEELMQNLDIAPTLLDICDVELPQDRKLDGKSLMPMLTGQKDSIHDELFFESGRTRAVCTRRWKYLALRHARPPETEKERYHGALQWLQAHSMLRHPPYFDEDQLYDLVNDPEETTNFAGDKPGVLEDLKERMDAWLATFGDHPFGEFPRQ